MTALTKNAPAPAHDELEGLTPEQIVAHFYQLPEEERIYHTARRHELALRTALLTDAPVSWGLDARFRARPAHFSCTVNTTRWNRRNRGNLSCKSLAGFPSLIRRVATEKAAQAQNAERRAAQRATIEAHQASVREARTLALRTAFAGRVKSGRISDDDLHRLDNGDHLPVVCESPADIVALDAFLAAHPGVTLVGRG